MTKVLKLSLIGPLVITQDDLPLADLTTAKAQALLCYLAVAARPFSRQALAGLLWGDLPEADARRNLRGVLMKLRQNLAPYLHITHQSLAFNRDSAYTLDVEDFYALTARRPDAASKVDHLRQALLLYRGDFLEDFHLRHAPAFEEWVMQQREDLRKRMLDALKTLTAVSLQTAAYDEGITPARHYLALEPSDEAAHRQLMTLLALSGQRSAALNQFDLCRAALQDELGIEPAEETAVLRDQIRANTLPLPARPTLHAPALASAPSPAANLPPSATFIAGPPITQPACFFGREREIKRLFHLLRHIPMQNAAIIGPRRAGKTSLLHYLKTITTAVPAQLRPHQPQDWLPNPHEYRWVFVDFQDTRLGDPQTLMQHLLAHMDLPVPDRCDLDTFLDIVSDELRTPTVILLDEIGVALERYPQLDDAFWESLRSLATNQVGGRLAYVLSAAETPDKLANQSGHGSPFFNIFGYVANLGPLKDEEARALIASSPIPFAEADVAWILAESGGWPMLLQILCRERLLALTDGETGDEWRADALYQIAPFRHEQADGRFPPTSA